MEMGGSASTKKVDPYVLAISIFAFSCLAVAGTAVCLYAEVRSPVVHAQRLPGKLYCQDDLTLPLTDMKSMRTNLHACVLGFFAVWTQTLCDSQSQFLCLGLSASHGVIACAERACPLQSFVGLGIFWVVLLAITGAYVLNYIKEEEDAAK